MLLDSEYAEFALSEEGVVEEAMRAFDKAVAKKLQKADKKILRKTNKKQKSMKRP